MSEIAVAGPGGRPTDYSIELADEICAHIIKGMSVRKIGMMETMPCEDTIYTWLAKYPEFSEKYERAVQHRTTKYMDECVDLSDTLPDGVMFIGLDGRLFERIEVLALSVKERAEAGLVPIGLTAELIGKRKLQIDTRMKAASRMHPRKYGDFLKQELAGRDGGPVTVEHSIAGLTTDELKNLAKLGPNG